MRSRRQRRDRGSVAVEAVLVVPALAVVVAFALVAGRITNTQGDVDAAARYAARQISIARVPTAAVAAAEADARNTLAVGSPTCRSMTFEPTITSTEVTVEIGCVVDLSAATVIPVPGSMRLSAVGQESLDQARENSGEFGISEDPLGANPSVGVPV